jgi:rare lipoprotein A (peptidoglycan hydrolase)
MVCHRLLRRAVLVGVLAATPALAAPGDLHRVTAEQANLRAEPSEDATVRRQLKGGEELLELRHEGEWYGVRLQRTGEEGWIAGTLIERVARSALTEPPQRSAATAGRDKAGTGDDAQPVFREEGEASVYGDEFQGKRTASGERFDQAKPQAAHPELPLGSEVTVTAPDTGKKVEVEVVDRGPHAKGRDLDLSEAAARKLGVLPEIRREGEAEVRIEATKGQVEEAIDGPEEVGKVEEQLEKARKEAAEDGTPQPRVRVDLEAPQEEAARR